MALILRGMGVSSGVAVGNAFLLHAEPMPVVPDGFTAQQVLTNISTAYAITYIFGLVGLILIIRFLPRLTGVDLAGEAAAHRSGITGTPGSRCTPRLLSTMETRLYWPTVKSRSTSCCSS